MSLDRDEVPDVVAAVRLGNPRALGRLISWIENGSPALPMIIKELAPATGHAHIVGLTGAPGVGKSTTVTG
ncbi:MAG TPA: methylmalonyl Co-A mutase-associated GTPase MeaB, partial [Propionibacteriaceae bacterium]|nr:methylmalonyl Co-A mutase-associated GTPase MeaB [Propionibacteriaceae bacterium]